MIYLYPSDFVINRGRDNTVSITFRKLIVDTVGNEVNLSNRLNALCGVVRDTGGGNRIIKAITARGNTLTIMANEPQIGSSAGFTEIARTVYCYDVNYNDSVYLRLSKQGLMSELKKSKLAGEVKQLPTVAELEKIIDTMIYNWLTMAAQQRGLLNVIKTNRPTKGQLRPRLISTGIPIMEMSLTVK